MTEGQNRRLSMRLLMEECVDVLLLEKGFLHTCRELLLRPGDTMRLVFRQATERLTPPVRFMILSVTAIAIAMNLTSSVITYGSAAPDNLPAAEQQQVDRWLAELDATTQRKDLTAGFRARVLRVRDALTLSRQEHLMRMFANWNSVILTLVVPVFALATWLVFRRGLNLAEHLAVASYVHGEQCLLAFVTMLPLGLMGWSGAGTLVYLTLSTTYQLWSWSQVFQFRSLRDWIVALALVALATGVYMLVGGLFLVALMVLDSVAL